MFNTFITPKLKSNFWSHLLILAISICFVLPSLITGKAIWSFDGESNIRAMFHLASQMKPNQIYLPQLGGGYPFGLDNSMAPNPLVGFWIKHGYDKLFPLFIGLYFYIAGWGAFKWLNSLGLTQNFSLLGAITWMCSTQLTGHLIIEGYPSMFATALIGHFFFETKRLLGNPDPISFCSFVFWISFGIWTAHPPIVVFAIAASFFSSFIQLWIENSLSIKKLFWVIPAILLTYLCCLPIVLAIQTLGSQSPRTGGTGLIGAIGGLPAESFFTLFIPGFWGRDLWGAGHFGRSFSSFNTIFIGPLLLFGLIPFKSELKNKTILGLVLALILFLLLSFGLPSPLAALVQQAGWPLSLLRLPVRWTNPFILTLIGFSLLIINNRIASNNFTISSILKNKFFSLIFICSTMFSIFLLIMPYEQLHTFGKFLSRDPGMVTALNLSSEEQFRHSGFILLSESLIFGVAFYYCFKNYINKCINKSILISIVLCLGNAFWDMSTFDREFQKVYIPKEVRKNDRILSMVTHQPINGNYLLMHEIFSQYFIGQLLQKGYLPIQSNMPLPHAAWQGLINGNPQNTSDNGSKVSRDVLRILGVKWVVTRHIKPDNCFNRKKEDISHDLGLGVSRLKGMAKSFVCLEKEILLSQGWIPNYLPDEVNPELIWWKQQKSLPGTYLVDKITPSKTPYDKFNSDPLTLLENPFGASQILIPNQSKKQRSMHSSIKQKIMFELKRDHILLSISTNKPKIAVLTIPYWPQLKATTNSGNSIPLTQISGVFPSFPINSGHHRIKLSFNYNRFEHLKASAIGFSLTFIIFLFGIFYNSKKPNIRKD